MLKLLFYSFGILDQNVLSHSYLVLFQDINQTRARTTFVFWTRDLGGWAARRLGGPASNYRDAWCNAPQRRISWKHNFSSPRPQPTQH